MTNAIRSEWIKLRTARSNVVLLSLAVLLPVALTVLLGFVVPESDLEGEDVFDLVLAGTNLGFILYGVLGILVIGQEYRHETIRVTFTADPNRPRVMVAKVVTVVLTGLVTGAVATGLSYVVGNAILTSRGFDFLTPGETQARAIAGAVALFALYGLAGLGLGAIIRATAGAITLFVVWPLVVEPIVGALISRTRKWLPFSASNALIDTGSAETVSGDPELLGTLASAIYFSAFALVLVMVGTVLVVRRDV